jgi:hypothetical protein
MQNEDAGTVQLAVEAQMSRQRRPADPSLARLISSSPPSGRL